MRDKLNDIFQWHFKSIEGIAARLNPNITDIEIKALKRECKSMVSGIIHEIGNTINEKTNDIEL